MLYHVLRFYKQNKIAILLFFILYIIPFFWLKPGQMDLGGDANRLYFYDPINFLKATALFDLAREGKGVIEPRYFYFPYVAFIGFLKFFFQSPTFVIANMNGLKLAGGFITIYLLVSELLSLESGKDKKYNGTIPSILAGIFYIVSFSSFHMSFFWDRALFTHDQIFLNPLIFYFLLKFLLSNKYLYLWSALLVSFIFSTNFSLLGAAPPLFAFYPIAITFLFLYLYFFSKAKVNLKSVGIAISFFLGIHSFHLLPELFNMVDSGSAANSIVFSKHGIENEGVAYFSAVHNYGQAVLNFLLPSENKLIGVFSIIFPAIIFIGVLLTRKKSFLFISLFFILTFFLATANITNLGYEFYRKLFYIPGFSMFRNFYTQWMYLFLFFYSLMIGFSLYTLFIRLKPHYKKQLSIFIFALFIINGFLLFLGKPVNSQVIRGSKNVSTVTRMDPSYEQTFDYIKKLPDGKILVLPLTDSFRQVISGKDGGAYEGPSTLLDLTTKYSFVGYQHFGYKGENAYADDVLTYSKNKDYDKLLHIFSLLNIRYILHNTDPYAYEKGFVDGSYTYVKTFLPKTQQEYKEYLSHLPLRIIYQKGPYILYEINDAFYNPMIFVPEQVKINNQISFGNDSFHSVFIDNSVCKTLNEFCRNYSSEYSHIKFKEINPTKFKVWMPSKKQNSQILIVLQAPFHNSWQLMKNNKPIGQHIPVNGYANGWILNSKIIPELEQQSLQLFLGQQRYFWYGWSITIIFLAIVVILLLFSLFKYEKN